MTAAIRTPWPLVAPASWFVYLVLGGGAIAAYYAAPAGGMAQAALITGVSATATAVALRTAHRQSGRVRVVWTALGIAMALSTVANVPYYTYLPITGQDLPFPSPADAFWLATYPCFMVALWAMGQSQRREDRRGDVLDSLILVLGGGTLLWVFAIAPVLATGGMGWGARAVALAYPVMDLLLFAFLVRLAVSTSWRNGSMRLLLSSFVALLVADTVYAMELPAGSYELGDAADALWMASYLLVGVAALHPTAAQVGCRAPHSAPRLSRGRQLFLSVAVLTGPLLVAVQPREQLATASLSAVTFLLVITRMTGLNQALERASAELQTRATTDSLTGLSNRAAFHARLDGVLTAPVPRGSTQALLFLDLDDFKVVNDTLGHAAGDALLQVVGQRLGAAVRDGDTVARLGGDEFALLLLDLPNVAAAHAAATRVMAALAEPLDIERQSISVNVSIGIAVRRSHSIRETLMHEADVAMYTAKGNGKHQVAVFDAALDRALSQHHALKADIWGAATRGELVVEYQPVVELATGRIVGAEALVRWQHPTRGLLPPSTFIELAEQNGAIIEVGQWVLETAVRQMSVWQRRLGQPELHLSVNLSGRQLDTVGLADQVGDVLASAGLPPTSLTLEVTESVIAAPGGCATESLNALRASGVRIAIDDFGSGYSSLAYLRRLPIDILKIDRSFVSGKEEGPHSNALLAAIVALGQHLGLDVIPEGIEETSHLTRLQALGCDTGQGFLLSRPLSAAVMEAHLLRATAIPTPRAERTTEEATVRT